MTQKKLLFRLLMAKLQNTFLQERKLQRIQESWKIPSFLEMLTMEGAAEELWRWVGAHPTTNGGRRGWKSHL